MSICKVLLVEDDPMVQEINRQFVEQVNGFIVIGTASNGLEALAKLQEQKPDLIIIDMYMPNLDGLTTLKQLRTNGFTTDVIAITAASDSNTVRKVLQYGALDYIMKPFKFERLKQALENYQIYTNKFTKNETITQADVDYLLFSSTESKQTEAYLPKGLNNNTLQAVQSFLQQQSTPISAEKVAEGLGIARVTARRYLEFLLNKEKVELIVEYGRVGRPINRYMKRT